MDLVFSGGGKSGGFDFHKEKRRFEDVETSVERVS